MAVFQILCGSGKKLSVEQKQVPFVYHVADPEGNGCDIMFDSEKSRWAVKDDGSSANRPDIDPQEIGGLIIKHLDN